MLVGDDQLSYRAIGLAMRVHNEIGPGLDELTYHQALYEKLSVNGISTFFKPSGVVTHLGMKVDEFEADIVVAGQIVLELKMLEGTFAPAHFLQLHCYQKFWSIPVGFLFDYGKERLYFERRVLTELNFPKRNSLLLRGEIPSYVDDRGLLAELANGLNRIVETHGFGYRDTTYRAMVRVELLARKLSFRECPRVEIVFTSRNHVVELDCFVVNEKMALLVTALHDKIRAADRAILQTYLRLLKLPWGLVVSFGKQSLDTCFVVCPRD